MSKKGLFYRGLTIPARLFFSIMEDGDVSKMIKSGNPKKKKLEEAFEFTFDRYFEKRNDGTLKLILKTRKRIIMLYRKIGIFEAVVLSLDSFEFPEDKVEGLIQDLGKGRVKLDPDVTLAEGLSKVLKIDIAGLRTHLQLEEHNLKELTKGESGNFEDMIVFFENVLERGINDDMTLAKYLSYQEFVGKKISSNKKKRK